MNMTDESCKLCGGSGPLRDSHIIPECVYKPVYDTKHRAATLDLRRASIPYVQKGLRERLLCAACEQKFGRWEDAFCRFWRPATLFGTQITQPHFCVSGFPYDAFKLFHLSVLWRAGVANSEAFRLVKLGPHEIHLRTILLKEEVPSDLIYPVSASVLRHPGSRGPFEALRHGIGGGAGERSKDICHSFRCLRLALWCVEQHQSISTSAGAWASGAFLPPCG
jgi:hypothetical protein